MDAMLRIFVFSFIALFVIECGSKSEQLQRLTVQSRVNETQKFNDISIKVKYVNDSRCPSGCECIWAGEARVFLKITKNESSMDTCLILPSQPNVKFMDYSVELKEVSPYPLCDNQFTPDYIFTFQVSVLR